MDIDITSGPLSLITSGAVVNFKDQPIEISFNGVLIAFFQVKSKDKTSGIKMVLNKDENRVVFNFINIYFSDKLPEPVEIGNIEIYDDLDQPQTHDLYIDLIYTPFTTNQFKIEYFLFSKERSNEDR